MKILVITLCITFASVTAYSQTANDTNVPFKAVATAPRPVPAPSLADSDLLKLRNIQIELSARVITMQDMSAKYQKLQSEKEQLEQMVNDWVASQAAKQHVDVKKFYFNFQLLKFVEQPPTPPEKPKQ